MRDGRGGGKGNKRPEERINWRPSDTQISNIDVTEQRSKPGQVYTLQDDILLIRLVERERWEWKDIARVFSGRTVQTLQNRYNRSLSIDRIGAMEAKTNPNATFHGTWTGETTNGRELQDNRDDCVLGASYTSMEESMYNDSSYEEGNEDKSMIHEANVVAGIAILTQL